MEHLDESEYEYFVKWCRYDGHNLATDNANLLVAHFQDMHGKTTDCTDELPDLSEELLLSQCLTGNYFDTNRYAMEMFGEDYD
ncbi:hypothetical protein [Bacteroides reticulotermitis]|uniref:hypothetical protein n=1 Tax=Bacteroides reticulotermitis TaxID=1133319 RepID=UPI003A862F57